MLLAATIAPAQEPAASTETPLHTRTEFSFTVDAPFDQVAPLFGANEERKWAPDWNPQFIYPGPAHDQQGMVFKVAHGQLTSVWVNTALDLAAGHIQYAYVLNDAMAVADRHPPDAAERAEDRCHGRLRTHRAHARSERACPAFRQRRRRSRQGVGRRDQRLLRANFGSTRTAEIVFGCEESFK